VKYRYYLLFSVYLYCFCLFCHSSFATSNDTLKAVSLHPYGRYLVNANGDLELISSAVHFGFRFSGSGCNLYAFIPDYGYHNYLQYTLDGVYQKRIKISGDSRQPLMINRLGKGNHTIWIYKATEATTGPIFIEKIVAHNISPLKNRDLPLIEFIGNSITCGAAADPSEIPCGSGEYQDQHNAYYAYGPRVARTLHANFLMSSVSGIGIYRNWNTDGPAMPQVYEKTDFQINSQRNWNFRTYHPVIVSIALGTNDFSEGDHKHGRLPFDSAIFVNNYIKFIRLVKSKYPGARIALLSSPMINGSRRILLQNCLKAVKSKTDFSFPGSKPVALFFFEPMQARGCGGHPSVEDHAILAQELIPFFKKLL
jgi:Carbohydrate esterase 2 N-terminal/GDSL-like Lipase/Acylhydrolase family